VAEERVRIEIAFEGGQIMSTLAAVKDVERLERHLEAGGDGAVELEVEDGRCLVVLQRVLYVKRFSKESRVGFSG
jgi:hypothetical protein